MSWSRIRNCLRQAPKKICSFTENLILTAGFVLPVGVGIRDYLFSQAMASAGHSCPLTFPVGFNCEVSPEYGDGAYIDSSSVMLVACTITIGGVTLLKTCWDACRPRSIKNGAELKHIPDIEAPLLEEKRIESRKNLWKIGMLETVKGSFTGAYVAAIFRGGVRELWTNFLRISEDFSRLDPDVAFRQAEKGITPYSRVGFPALMSIISLFFVYHEVKRAKLENKLLEHGKNKIIKSCQAR